MYIYCYLEGTFRCTNHGKSTIKSRAVVSSCSLTATPYADITITPERYDNMELIEWGNIIRN